MSKGMGRERQKPLPHNQASDPDYEELNSSSFCVWMFRQFIIVFYHLNPTIFANLNKFKFTESHFGKIE